MKTSYLIFIYALFCQLALAQNDSPPLYSPSVEEILNQPVNKDYNAVSITLATKSQTALEETPAIISVITERDIAYWGFRDLADILRTVQGFEFGIDVFSLYGLSLRGMWIHEGKVLMMINGTAINCFGYGNGNFIGTIPASMIERVEIIRGPGSALYGGFAEVAVINVITKSQQNQIQSYAGIIGKDFSYGGNVSLNVRKNNEMYLSAQIGAQFTPTSNRTYIDFWGGYFPMGAESSWRRWRHTIIEGRYKNFRVSYNHNFINFMAQDSYGIAVPKTSQGGYTNELYNKIETLQLKYDISLGKGWLFQPLVEFSKGNSAATPVSQSYFVEAGSQLDGHPIFVLDSSYYWQNRMIGATYKTEQQFFYKGKRTECIIGAGLLVNTLHSIATDGRQGIQFSPNPSDTTNFLARPQTFMMFQYIKNIYNFKLLAGSRYEITPFGNAWAPRLGVTWSKDRPHVKVLYGRAFRVPLLWQAFSRMFFTQQGLKPETTNTIEFEIGYKFSPTLRAALNTFWIDIEQPITYIGANDSYQNYGKIGSVGVEGELSWRTQNHGLFANFAYVRPTQQTVPDFLSEDKKHFLAVPSLKFNSGAYYQWRKVSIAPSLTYLSARYGQSVFSAQNSTIEEVIFQTTRYEALFLLNLALSFQKITALKLDISLQIHNLLNSNYVALQPYYGGHAPMPVHDRQFTIGIGKTF
ncbi:MAG: TonB-dependent receptor plug domain-containing protein [Microscillaceae bacterium]|nr:TonB-dependent receptor plug domain-containing protein [Microscillaceae bacterium]MDW8460279.1 TonB-dependent receptor plug domain-containing protein [Cytophagales bacterium]